MVQVAQRDLDELRAEVTVARAERVAFTTAVRVVTTSALLAIGQPQPDHERVERLLREVLRLAAREDARARAAGVDDPAPASTARAA